MAVIIVPPLATGDVRIHDRVTMLASKQVRLLASHQQRQCPSSRSFGREHGSGAAPYPGSAANRGPQLMATLYGDLPVESLVHAHQAECFLMTDMVV